MTGLDEAVSAIRAGRLVVVPTDTVYGIAARPDVPDAVRAIFEAKGRPDDKPLPVLGADIDVLRAVARFDDRAERVAGRFWPGALTIVLPRAPGFDHDLGGDDAATVAVRVPSQPLTRALLRETGPLAVTSANVSGDPPCASVEEAWEVLGPSVDVYLDGGILRAPASTVVSLVDEVVILRGGAVTLQQIEECL